MFGTVRNTYLALVKAPAGRTVTVDAATLDILQKEMPAAVKPRLICTENPRRGLRVSLRPLELDMETYLAYVDSNAGCCLYCNEWQESGCEPDMTEGPCESCGERLLTGCEELLVMGLLEVDGA